MASVMSTMKFCHVECDSVQPGMHSNGTNRVHVFISEYTLRCFQTFCPAVLVHACGHAYSGPLPLQARDIASLELPSRSMCGRINIRFHNITLPLPVTFLVYLSPLVACQPTAEYLVRSPPWSAK